MTRPSGGPPSHALFADRVGETVTLMADDGTEASATLTDCTLSDPATGSFTLDVFVPSLSAGQGTYLVRAAGRDDAPALETAVFLVPVGRDGDGIRLHAVFNYLVPAGTESDRG